MLLIKNGTIHLEDGSLFTGDLLTEGKEIRSIGSGIDAPAATQINAAGLDVFPGLILPLCNIGVRGDNVLRDKDHTEDAQPINPQMEIKYSFNARDLNMQHMGRTGITAYGLTPGTTPLIAGKISLISTLGKNWDEMVILEDAGMKGNYNTDVMSFYAAKHKMPTTHMGMYYLLDKAFTDAGKYMDKADSDFDQVSEALVPVLKGELPFFVNTYSLSDIDGIFQLAQKHGFRPVFCGAYAVDKYADKIIEAGYDVVAGEFTYLFRHINHGTDLGELVRLYRRGLRLSLGSCGDEGYPPAYDQLMWSAILLRQAGATPGEVMDMMTVNAARAMGATHLTGSIARGKRADLIICRGNPAEKYTNRVEYTIAAGSLLYQWEGES